MSGTAARTGWIGWSSRPPAVATPCGSGGSLKQERILGKASWSTREPDYAPVWEAEPDAIASQAARDLAVVEAQQDVLAQEQAALEDVRENLSRATRLGARKPARTRPPSRPPRKTAKRRKRAS
jgi:hypothetical protein